MSLALGARLGPYQIEGILGVGGMGEVYRASDTRLGREVAIKVLPAHYSSDPERMRRFEQEARAVGVLNHPNILNIHDVGTHEGMPYVVSELLEGETLRSRLNSGGPVPYRKAIEYGLQIAHGLAEAHEKGIVHRDLKPENLFLTRDGRLKILDFGLAKLTHNQPEVSEKSFLPTVSITEAGVVLGTAGYMAPEQVRGKIVDHRCDIFTFGAILYEMLSGRRAFQGDSTVETMSAILKQDPPDLTTVSSLIPPATERIVRHCIEKNPEERFQSARDLAFALETVSSVSSFPEAAVAGPPVWKRRVPLLLLLMLLPLLVVAYFAGTQTMVKVKNTPVSYRRLTFQRGLVSSARFAPDGQTVVYGASWNGNPIQVFLTRQDSSESRPLLPEKADILSVSRAGEMLVSLGRRFTLGYVTTGTLARVSIAGGAPRQIVENVQDGDWHPQTSEIAIVSAARRLEYPPGKLLYQAAGWISSIRFSPDGKWIAFQEHDVFGDNGGNVAIVDLSGNHKRLAGRYSGLQGLAWVPDGSEIWFTGARVGTRAELYAVSPNGKLRKLPSQAGNLVLYDISPQGDVLLSLFDARRGMTVVPAGEEEERDLSWFEWSFATDLSTNGDEILFTEQGEGAGNSYAAYLRKTDGSPAVRLGDGWGVSLSPDGKYMLGITYPQNSGLFVLPTGPGTKKELPTHGIAFYEWARFSHDGNAVFFTGREKGRINNLYSQALDGRKPRKVTEDDVSLNWAVSPDGSQVIAVLTDNTVRICSADGSGCSPIPELNGYIPVEWLSDGSKILVVRPGAVPAEIMQYDLNTRQISLWKTIIPSDLAGINSIGYVLATPDAKTYAYSYRRTLSDLYLAKGLISSGL